MPARDLGERGNGEGGVVCAGWEACFATRGRGHQDRPSYDRAVRVYCHTPNVQRKLMPGYRTSSAVPACSYHSVPVPSGTRCSPGLLLPRYHVKFIKINIHFGCEMEDFVETHLCKLCVILRSRIVLCVSSLKTGRRLPLELQCSLLVLGSTG